MKLRTKLFHITDAKSNDIDPDGLDIILMHNGQPTETRLSDVFTDIELEENEIYGNSLLSYMQLQDGKLVAEGSTIELAIAGTHERILINAITRPGLNDDTQIPFEHIQKFAEFFTLTKPDEVFIDLTADEKQFFIDGRLKKQDSEKQIKQAYTDAENAKAEQARKKAEADIKAGIDPEYIQEKKDFLSTQSFYRSQDFKEHVDGPYHLFYGQSETETAFLLIKRGADWWEQPEDAVVTDETDKTLSLEFTDGKALKQIVLDIATGQTTVTNAQPAE